MGGGTTSGTHSSVSNFDDPSGTPPSAQNCAVPKRPTVITTGQRTTDRNGYYLNRLIGHADLHLSPLIRVFAELQSGLESGRNGGHRPAIDEDKPDLGQLFLELRPSTRQDRVPIAARVGRHDLNYGDGSLVSLRDLNVRRALDGITPILQRQEWRIDVFAAKPVVTSPGFFDDAPDHTPTFWGIWATDRKKQSFVRQLDFYYLGPDRKNAQFDQGTARKRRSTFGLNADETACGFSLLQEGDLQFGTFGAGQLLAWKLANKCLTHFHEFGIIRPSYKTSRSEPAQRYFADCFSALGELG